LPGDPPEFEAELLSILAGKGFQFSGDGLRVPHRRVVAIGGADS
jgi:hypothetical protein